MNKAQAKTYLRRFADMYFETTKHCRERMAERNATIDDILNVIHWGEVVELEENREYDNWLCTVKGVDIEGEDLVLIAAIDENKGSVLCITVKGD